MRIDSEGGGKIAVTEQFLDCLHIRPPPNKEARQAMPQVVKPEAHLAILQQHSGLYCPWPKMSIIPIITIPVTVLLAFIPMQQMGLTANIMSLGGIAVAITMVDAAIVVVEQTHKKLEHWDAEGRPGDYSLIDGRFFATSLPGTRPGCGLTGSQ